MVCGNGPWECTTFALAGAGAGAGAGTGALANEGLPGMHGHTMCIGVVWQDGALFVPWWCGGGWMYGQSNGVAVERCLYWMLQQFCVFANTVQELQRVYL